MDSNEEIFDFLEGIQRFHLARNGRVMPTSHEALRNMAHLTRANIYEHLHVLHGLKMERGIERDIGWIHTPYEELVTGKLACWCLHHLLKVEGEVFNYVDEIPLRDRPLFSTAYFDEANAEIRTIDKKHTFVILSERMLNISQKLFRAIGPMFFEEEGRERLGKSTANGPFEWDIDPKAEAHFYDLMLSTTLGLGPETAKTYIEGSNPSETGWKQGVLSFMLAHGYAHHWLYHLKRPAVVRKVKLKDPGIYYRYLFHSAKEEYKADALAAVMCVHAAEDSKTPEQPDLCSEYVFGALAYLKCLDLMEKARRIEEGLAEKQHAGYFHPPASWRVAMLLRNLKIASAESEYVQFCNFIDGLWMRFEVFHKRFVGSIKAGDESTDELYYYDEQYRLYRIMEKRGAPCQWEE